MLDECIKSMQVVRARVESGIKDSDVVDFVATEPLHFFKESSGVKWTPGAKFCR